MLIALAELRVGHLTQGAWGVHHCVRHALAQIRVGHLREALRSACHVALGVHDGVLDVTALEVLDHLVRVRVGVRARARVRVRVRVCTMVYLTLQLLRHSIIW